MDLNDTIRSLDNSFHKEIIFTKDIPEGAKENIFSELLAMNEYKKLRADCLSDLRTGFGHFTKPELIEQLVKTQDKLSETSYELDERKRMIKNASKMMVEVGRDYSHLYKKVYKLGYDFCSECGELKKR